MREAHKELEEKFGEFVGNPNMVVCSSGTAALHLAFEVLKEYYEFHEDPIAVPDTAMIACPRAVKLAGMIPNFVSVSGLGLLLPQEVDKEYHSAALAIHLYGRKATTDLPVPVVEDLAEAHGIDPNPNSFAACWSFYKNKVIAGEEGGAVCFQTEEAADYARSLRSLGMTETQDFNHLPRGMNYRLSNANAELVLENLKKYQLNLESRKRVEIFYDQLIPEGWKLPQRDIPWVYDLDLPEGTNIQNVVQGLNRNGVPARVAFKPMSTQEEFKQDRVCPLANYIATRRIYLPIFPHLRQDTVARIVKLLVDLVSTD